VGGRRAATRLHQLLLNVLARLLENDLLQFVGLARIQKVRVELFEDQVGTPECDVRQMGVALEVLEKPVFPALVCPDRRRPNA